MNFIESLAPTHPGGIHGHITATYDDDSSLHVNLLTHVCVAKEADAVYNALHVLAGDAQGHTRPGADTDKYSTVVSLQFIK